MGKRRESTTRLRRSEVASYRHKLLIRQGRKCALCGNTIEKGDDTLDHDHHTGHCRAVLHRNCNQIEGRIRHWAERAYCDPIDFLENILELWNGNYDHFALHPNHRTEKEKKIKKLKQRMKKLKTDRGRQRIKDEIDNLMQEDC